MRTYLLQGLLLIAALPAQEPGHPAFELPPRAPMAAAPTETAPEVPPAAEAALADLGARLAAEVQFDRPRDGAPLWALGHRWKASFDGRGATVIPFFGSQAPQNHPLRFELTAATVGGRALPLPEGAAQRDGAVVRTARGALTEVYATGLDQLEQSFVFATLPRRGAVAVELDVTTDLQASTLAEGVRFANEHGHVDYTHAIATDAAGRSLPLVIERTARGVRIEIPESFVAEATLPLVLDPVLNFWYALGNPATLQRNSDVASIQVPGLNGRTLIVYSREFSASDHDCWGILFDGGLGLVATDFAIDFTGDDWTDVAVAGNNYAQNFLVVAEVRLPILLGSTYHIAGRTVAANAALGTLFDIERNGVIGLGGDNFHPDVGGDPYYGPGRYTVVFQKNSGSAADIYMKQVTPAGGLVTTNPLPLGTSTAQDQRPSISKSCGQSNGPVTWWLVTWQHTYSAADDDIYGRFVNWNGAVIGSEFAVAVPTFFDSTPSSGSPIDANGTRYWPVCYETASAPGQPRDVVCRLIRQDTGLQADFTVSNGVPGQDDFAPEVDSDGTRFVTMMTTGNGIEAVTAAWLPASNTFRIEERTGLQTSGAQLHGQGNVCADYSGGNAVSPRYFLSFTNFTTNTFNLVNYGGYPGGLFFTTRQTQCGNLPISVGGSPVIGQTVNASVGFGALSGIMFGVPGYIPLNVLGCSCALGVDQAIQVGNPVYWTVPNDPRVVGIPLSMQGWTVVGSQCLGVLDLSDTVDFTIR
ncbi:MAG: hypothetical protein H6835_00835 [Planctomycetes bacterium]|nr:hypothetical protein [Planctomycetota bacterium]